jgi:topoisomerase IV subunit A
MAKAVPPPPSPPSAPIDINLRDALEERYLAYALSTIMGRALPDARDGLKPVHRRILYGMHILKLDPGTAFKKCAKIVGDVMGSFHPHGDQAIYEALVRLAQDFASRYPLIEGQGNFGNIDGDNAAAYRYTEARLTDVARLLMEGVEEDSVDWRDNYSGDAKEPIVMPSAVPNLLANGAQGIAVGMATSIPRRSISSPIPAPRPRRSPLSSTAPTFRPAASSSTRRPRSSRPTGLAAAPSGSAPAGRRKTRGAVAGSRS